MTAPGPQSSDAAERISFAAGLAVARARRGLLTVAEIRAALDEAYRMGQQSIAAPVPSEVVVENVARAIYATAGEAAEGHPWEEATDELRDEVRGWAAAASAAMPASSAEAAVKRVEALADSLDVDSCDPMPDDRSRLMFETAQRIRAALAGQHATDEEGR